MLKNLKFGIKLGLGFGVVLFLTVIILTLGLSKMKQIDDRLNRIVKVNNIKVENANAAARAILNISNNLRITDNEAAKTAQKDRIEADRKIYRDALAKLKELETNQEGLQAIKNIENAIASANETDKKFMELYMANKTSEAGAVLMNEHIPLTQKITEEFDKLIQFEQQRNETRYEEAKQVYGSAKFLMLIFGVATLIIGITISIIITRAI